MSAFSPITPEDQDYQERLAIAINLVSTMVVLSSHRTVAICGLKSPDDAPGPGRTISRGYGKVEFQIMGENFSTHDLPNILAEGFTKDSLLDVCRRLGRFESEFRATRLS